MATDTPAPPAPTEIGYVNPGSDDFYADAAWDPSLAHELQWPESIRTFDAMRNGAGQTAAIIDAVTLPIEGTTWRIDPNGARDEVVRFIADQLDLPIIGEEGEKRATRRTGRFTWSEHLHMALLMVVYGHMFFEQIVQPTEDGKWGLRKLAPRMPQTLSAINVARDGGLDSIEQHPPHDLRVVRASDATGTVRIPVDRLVAYSYRREGGDWAGRSLFRPAYPHWWAKKFLEKLELQAIERNSMGVPVYEGPAGATKEDLKEGKKLAQAHRAGSNAGAAVPNGAALKLLGVSGQLMTPREAIEYHNAEIGKVALTHFLNLNKGGSYALARPLEELFTQSLTSTANIVADTATQHIVADLVDWNYGEDEAIPRVVYDDLRTDTNAVANAIRTLADAGIIRPDRSLEEWVRRDLGAPAKDTPPPPEEWTPELTQPDDTEEVDDDG